MDGKRYDTFISFNSADRESALALDRELGARQLSVWLDERDMNAGLAPGQLAAAISSSESITVLCGIHNEGPWQSYEVETAISAAIQKKKLIIPVLLPGADRKNIPDSLEAFSHVVFSGLQNAQQLALLDRKITGAHPGTLRRREVENLLECLTGSTITDELASAALRPISRLLPSLDLSKAPAKGEGFAHFFRELAQTPHRPGHMPALDFLAACRPHLAGLDTLNSDAVDRWIDRIYSRLGRGGEIARAAISAIPKKRPAADVLIKISQDKFSELFFSMRGCLSQRLRQGLLFIRSMIKDASNGPSTTPSGGGRRALCNASRPC